MWDDENIEIPSYLEAIEIAQENPSVEAMLDWLDNEFVYECGEDFDINFDVE